MTGESGTAALAQLAEEGGQPDLIISDYRLANGRTGIEAIERLRDALGSAIPAFLISGDTGSELLREASVRGYQLVHKPVLPMELRTTLEAPESPGCCPLNLADAKDPPIEVLPPGQNPVPRPR